MKKFLLIITLVLVPTVTYAHCPLCTVGAGILAVTAAALGISSVIVGVMVGAFAIALSLWLPKLVRKNYIPYQNAVIGGIVFLSTVLPIIPLIRDYAPLYLALGGPYGSLLHRTYTINLFLVGLPLGVVVVLLAPYVSKVLTKMLGRRLPYQGLGITFGLLILVSVIIYFLS